MRARQAGTAASLFSLVSSFRYRKAVSERLNSRAIVCRDSVEGSWPSGMKTRARGLPWNLVWVCFWGIEVVSQSVNFEVRWFVLLLCARRREVLLFLSLIVFWFVDMTRTATRSTWQHRGSRVNHYLAATAASTAPCIAASMQFSEHGWISKASTNHTWGGDSRH